MPGIGLHTYKTTARYIHCSSTVETQLQPPPIFLIITFIPSSLDLFPLLCAPALPPKVRDCLSGPRYTHNFTISSSKLPVPVNFLLPKLHNLLHSIKRQFSSLKAKVIITHKLLCWERILWTGAWQTKSDFNSSSPALPLHGLEAQEYELPCTDKWAQRKNTEPCFAMEVSVKYVVRQKHHFGQRARDKLQFLLFIHIKSNLNTGNSVLVYPLLWANPFSFIFISQYGHPWIFPDQELLQPPNSVSNFASRWFAQGLKKDAVKTDKTQHWKLSVMQTDGRSHCTSREKEDGDRAALAVQRHCPKRELCRLANCNPALGWAPCSPVLLLPSLTASMIKPRQIKRVHFKCSSSKVKGELRCAAFLFALLLVASRCNKTEAHPSFPCGSCFQESESPVVCGQVI